MDIETFKATLCAQCGHRLDAHVCATPQPSFHGDEICVGGGLRTFGFPICQCEEFKKEDN